MALIQIPREWRQNVLAVLETGRSGDLIEWTLDGRKRYEADSNFAWEYELYEALQTFLDGSACEGCTVQMAGPTGEAYEFYFAFKGIKFYGKLLLRSDRRRVIIFSAHRPLKAKLSCQ